ncbi:MAG: rnhA [Alphaproteobacteria bacterium]|jgi:ribonuclease HI|nr:rnhA [Alphaproteobacteria bacterium]
MVVTALQNETQNVIDTLKAMPATLKPRLEAYTDGACSGNPGPGGWGAVLRYQGIQQDLSGGDTQTTNNRMEMSAAIGALEALPHPAHIDIYTDSQYLRDGITRWMVNWKKNGWMTADKKPVKNKDLWLRLDALTNKHQVSWHWVKGHSGHPENEHADALARNAIIAQRMKMMG